MENFLLVLRPPHDSSPFGEYICQNELIILSAKSIYTIYYTG